MDSDRNDEAGVRGARPGDRPPRRLTRAEQKARTRALLLDATARVFARKGFVGASVEEIAELAGYSVGAVYSNFGSKEDMFLELIRARASEQVGLSYRIMDNTGASLEERLHALGELLERATEGDAESALLQAELWLYAVRNERAMQAFSEAMREPQQQLVEMMRSALGRVGGREQVSPERMATVVLALFHGLVRERLLDPSAVPFELYGQALRWMFRGIAAIAAQGEGPPDVPALLGPGGAAPFSGAAAASGEAGAPGGERDGDHEHDGRADQDGQDDQDTHDDQDDQDGHEGQDDHEGQDGQDEQGEKS